MLGGIQLVEAHYVVAGSTTLELAVAEMEQATSILLNRHCATPEFV